MAAVHVPVVGKLPQGQVKDLVRNLKNKKKGIAKWERLLVLALINFLKTEGMDGT